VLADAGRGDYILCQITSNQYADPHAIELRDDHFRRGSLRRTSYVRPGKLFTANDKLIAREAAEVKADFRRIVVEAIEGLLRRGL
jgi:mRNA interferase MazF